MAVAHDEKKDPFGNTAVEGGDSDTLLDEFTEESDLKNPNRRVCVVTTAALPWRTGTAVNPLLRALYLTRGRPSGYVTLVIPWLQDEKSQTKLYGKVLGNKHEQEQWIRSYARERAECPTEEEALKILFYDAKYQESFGSIFPIVDVCNLIPEADIAILEEPEHLNWFRVPSPSQLLLREDYVRKVSSITAASSLDSPNDKQNNSQVVNEEDEEADGVEEVETDSQTQNGSKGETEKDPSVGQDENGLEDEKKESQDASVLSLEEKQNIAELGWKYRFRHVVGILHTNYSAYMKQYGVGTSLIGAPAIGILSSIVVKAYCHRVIRLSAVLPSLAPGKEVTANVHGVRAEFLEEPVPVDAQQMESDNTAQESTPSTVYFIGKLIWAKGFDKLLQIQDLYRRATGDYFPIDVYGAGSDEKAIRRGFFGRRGSPDDQSESSDESEGIVSEEAPSSKDARAAAVFDSSESLRARVYAAESDRFVQQHGFEATIFDPSDEYDDAQCGPLSILGDFSGKSLGTALSTSRAVYKLADVAVCNGLSLAISWEDERERNAPFVFDLPQSLHEWRRNPIPARFHGVKDHAQLNNVPQQRIFLNPSVTEVLCTTTAEALAMGKFAIIPNHPSNEFFLQFPNCLAYKTLDECVEKLQWALARRPKPLSAEHRRCFTWEAATERLYQASGITRREMKAREDNGYDKARRVSLARLHVEFGKKGQFIGNLFRGDNEKESSQSGDNTPIDT